MRTLLVSDLHLGNGHRRDVLRRTEAQERLWDALRDVDRLVLLGDIVELMGRRPQAAMDVAAPVLRELGRRLGPEREVVIVPGNHDAPLARRWAVDRGDRLADADAVPLDASSALAALAGWLAPARVRASYPGVWLAPGIWATHGHLLDRHLVPASTIGLLRPPLGADRMLRRPADYERARRRDRGQARQRARMSPAARLLERPLGTIAEELIGLARTTLAPSLARLAAGAGAARLTAAGLDLQMRRSAAPALTRVVQRLGVEAEWVVFGHVHRRGPLGDGDRPWSGDGHDGIAAALDRPRLVNTGSWMYEPLLLQGVRPPHPYWPGGAVLLGDDGVPRSLGLLDDLQPGDGSDDGDGSHPVAPVRRPAPSHRAESLLS